MGDLDCDGVVDATDNCPSVANTSQLNSNGEPIPLPSPFPFGDATNPKQLAVGDACNADLDNDGLDTSAERAAGTSGALSDTDGDRQLDGPEVACGSNPLDPLSRVVGGPDADSDLLPDACEAIAGTDPNAADSDGDGVIDGVEFLRLGTNPLLRDTDGDGCNDAREVASLNADRVVSSGDLGIAASRYSVAGQPLYFWNFDVNRDGAINSIDLLFIAVNVGPCEP